MGHTPFGYRIENGKAVIDEAAAAQVRDLYKNYLSGLSLTNAAKEAGLNLLHAGAKRMMLNRHYLGDDFYPAIIDTMWKAITKQLFRRIFSYGCRKNWYAGEWSRQAPMVKSAPTAATTALRRLLFAANAVKCSAESTGTIAAANPSSGAASVDWSQPDRNTMQEPSMRRYWKMW